ncbi:hypothetical protein J6590_075097 [Homalodisca vitripennis]|nr:hypothetical protein J6590_075097 [Homalodisca vitripennis]
MGHEVIQVSRLSKREPEEVWTTRRVTNKHVLPGRGLHKRGTHSSLACSNYFPRLTNGESYDGTHSSLACSNYFPRLTNGESYEPEAATVGWQVGQIWQLAQMPKVPTANWLFIMSATIIMSLPVPVDAFSAASLDSETLNKFHFCK